MEENNRDFKGIWIAREVWLDTRLNALEKIILMEIDSLDSTERGCYASNKYIAEFCQCSETKVSTAISKLVQLGYLTVKSFDGRQRELKSSLSNSERQPYNFSKAAVQSLKESNIDNKQDNKIDRNNIVAVVEYLNKKAGTHYRANSKATARHIEARFNDGFTLQDFFAVIDKKVAEWKGGSMEQYLRPETLFGSKFEGYLNARSSAGSRRGANGVLMDDRTADELDAIF